MATMPAPLDHLREGKGTMFEGGCREPTVMRWPGQDPGGQNV